MDHFYYSKISQRRKRRSRQISIMSVYRNVIDNIRKVYRISQGRIDKAFSDLVGNKELDSSPFEFYIANMIYFYPCYTELAFNHMSAFLDVNARQTALPESDINIVSIGDGAGHDVMGFVSAMCEKKLPLEKMKITIIDKLLKWQLFFSVLISDIQEGGNMTAFHTFFNGLNFNYNFIQAEIGNCDQDTENNVKEALIEADFVLMVNILINVDEEKKIVIMEDMATSMKDGALLYISEEKEFLVPEFRSLKENFKVIYSGNQNAHIMCTTSTMNYSCKECCDGYAVILKKEKKPTAETSGKTDVEQ